MQEEKKVSSRQYAAKKKFAVVSMQFAVKATKKLQIAVKKACSWQGLD
jgi:hypothetical protein